MDWRWKRQKIHRVANRKIDKLTGSTIAVVLNSKSQRLASGYFFMDTGTGQIDAERGYRLYL